MANRPPLPVLLPARMVVPAMDAGPQSLKPRLMVSASTGAFRRGWIRGRSDWANPNAANSAALTILMAMNHRRFDAVIGGFFWDCKSIAMTGSFSHGTPSSLALVKIHCEAGATRLLTFIPCKAAVFSGTSTAAHA